MIQTKQRYYLLDAFRGLSMLAVIWYHTLWDLVNLYDVSMPWFDSDVGFVVQRTIRWCFVLLAGFCVSMGSRPAKRGLFLLVCSAAVTGVSYIVGSPIHFGVLTFLGSASLLYALWKRIAGKRTGSLWLSVLGLVLSICLFVFTNKAETGQIWGIELPQGWYANYFTAFLGFPNRGFQSSDYVPLIPWLFAYGAGYFLHSILIHCKWMHIFCKLRVKPLEFIGRHSLLVYLLHQPVVYAILVLIF